MPRTMSVAHVKAARRARVDFTHSVRSMYLAMYVIAGDQQVASDGEPSRPRERRIRQTVPATPTHRDGHRAAPALSVTGP
jgi:hypothetical protein